MAFEGRYIHTPFEVSLGNGPYIKMINALLTIKYTKIYLNKTVNGMITVAVNGGRNLKKHEWELWSSLCMQKSYGK